MIIISDSPLYLLEKVAISKGIKQVFIKGFPCEIEEKDLDKADFVLILITDSFYDQLGIIDESFNISVSNFEEIFSQLENILKTLNDNGIITYLSMLPKHFLYMDPNSHLFYEKNSKDFYINHINYSLMMLAVKYSNTVLINGIEKINPNISKTFFRFSSIYDKSNSELIFKQVFKHRNELDRKCKKLIIVDLDNTLWKGILGDDFKDGIRMDQSDPIGSIFHAVQKILLDFKSKGFLLALCSKNDESLALDALFNSPSSQFSMSDIVSHRINWEPKSKNILEICNELNISPKETIFIDDSIYECDEVRRVCSDISVFIVPKDLYSYPYLLSTNPLFALSKSTLEDKNRTDFYKKGILKKKLYEQTLQSNGTKEDWIKSLKLELRLSLIDEDNKNLDRVIQLFNRTNQFNLSGSKFNKKTFIANLKNDKKFYYFGYLSDRIGSEGIISVLGFYYDGLKIIIEDFIVSCRVFGRNIEQSMLIPVLDFANEKAVSIEFNFTDTKRNKFLKNFITKEFNNFSIPKEKILIFLSRYSKLHVKLIKYNSNFFNF